MLSAQLTDIEIVGNVNNKRDYFFVVYVDDEEVLKSERRFGIGPLRWDKADRLHFHPSSNIKFKLFRHSMSRLRRHEIGQHECRATRLLENDAVTLDLTDGTRITLASLNIKFSLITDQAEDIMRQVDADLERLKNNGVFNNASGSINNAMVIAQTGGDAAGLIGSSVAPLGQALKMFVKVMDSFADAHPIVKVSWTLISAVYKTVRAQLMQDEAVRDLAESLREMVGVAAEFPDLRKVKGTTDVIEEIGRASLEVALLIDEYARHSFLARAARYQLTDDMKSRIDQCQKNCRDIIKKFDRRVRIETNKTVGKLDAVVQEEFSTLKDKALAKEISVWLNAPDSSRNYNDARKKHQAETCSWFIDGENFSDWKNNGGFLCVYGKAGCGKTILCSSIIAHTVNICEKKESSACAYFFFDGRDAQSTLQRHDGFIRSLIQQFTDKCGGIPTCLAQLYGSGHQQPPTEALEDVLQDILQRFQDGYVIIDSLDECAERRELIAWINKVTSSTGGPLHLLSTSRPENYIVDELKSPRRAPIVVEDESVNDIKAYIESNIRTDLKEWDEHNQNKIKDALVKGAHGMFRWVALQLEGLRDSPNVYALEKQLRSLPDGLDETYERILMKIKKHYHDDTKRFLTWIAFSTDTLTLEELAEVVVVDFEASNRPTYDPKRKYRDQKDVLLACSGLITNSEGFVKLAHFSVKEYLVSDRITNGAAKDFRINEKLSHYLIAETSLAYLLEFDTFEALERHTIDGFPLARYAATNWTFHVEAGGGDGAHTVQTLILALLGSKFPLMNWIRLWDPENPRRGLQKHLTSKDIGEPLFYASLLGFVGTSQKLLDDGACINSRGGSSMRRGNALHAACHEGHGEVVKLLIKRGVDINIEAGWYDYALHAACYGGHSSVVKMLLETGADVDRRGMFGTALRVAAHKRDEILVELLLDHGADANEKEGEGGSALYIAAFYNHMGTVKLLLDRGADINEQGGEYGTALQAAICNSNTGVVKLLLDRGADVNAQGGKYGTTLHTAAFCSDPGLVELLLERGADVNILEGLFGNPLQAAVMTEDENTVELLLGKHADANAQGGIGGSALLLAAALGTEGIVKLLLAHHADVNARVRDFTSIYFTQYYPPRMMELFREKEADIDAEGEYGHALQAASHRGHTDVVEILLRNGADVNARGGNHGNALQAALDAGHDDIVELLLEQGAAPPQDLQQENSG